ncbi:MAG: alpha/beta fold hydrolase [Patescibacteria group bacterium]
MIQVEKPFGGRYEKLSTGAQIRFHQGEGEGLLPTVLIVHGWKSAVFSSEIYVQGAQALCEQGYNVVMLSMRGHPGAEGSISEVTRHDNLNDIKAAVRWIQECPETDATRLCAWGTSYGGYLLSVLCPQIHFELLALRAPASYPEKGWDEPFEPVTSEELAEWRKVEHDMRDESALAGLEEFRGDFFMVNGSNDETMPPTVGAGYGRASLRARSRFIYVLDGAPHTLREPHRSQFISHLATWFGEHRPKPSLTPAVP